MGRHDNGVNVHDSRNKVRDKDQGRDDVPKRKRVLLRGEEDEEDGRTAKRDDALGCNYSQSWEAVVRENQE